MNRRAFLSTLTAALASATLDPERLLWRPGAKTIFLPSVIEPSVELTFVTEQWIGRETACIWRDHIVGLRPLDKPFDALIGNTVSVRLPQRFVLG